MVPWAGRRRAPGAALAASSPADLDSSARGDLKAAAAAKAGSEIELRLSKRIFSAPELMAGWQTQEAPGLSYSGPVFSVTLAVPILDHRQADKALAAAQRSRAEAELAALEARAQAEIGGARAAYERLAREAGERERHAAELPAMTHAAVLAYRLGETTLTDFLDTVRAALAASVRGIDTYALALESHRGLELAAGRPLFKGDEQ